MVADETIPTQVADLIAMAERAVTDVVGVAPDLTPETLPLVDRYLETIPSDTRDAVLELALASVGCYFGEVVRRRFKGRWALDDQDTPASWRIELAGCFLTFRPVGMAGEVFVGRQTPDHDGAFATRQGLRGELDEMLSRAAPLPADEYFSLAGRVDVLELVADWLTGRTAAALAEAEDHELAAEPLQVSAQEYREALERGEI